MKEYNITEFCHIKPSIPELKNYSNQDIVIQNFANQIPTLQKYNKEGYNVYKTFNSFFDGKRRTENINKLQAIFIDIDYKDKEKEDYITLRKKCKFLEKKYGIYPYEINDTYKGYHLLFALEESLHYLKNEYYLDMASALVEYFDGDKLAKQITGLYKVVGFIDHKDNRNFLIENKYSATSYLKEKHAIKKDTLEAFGTICEDDKLKDILKDRIYGIKTKWNNKGHIDFSKFELEKNEKLSKLNDIIEKKTGKQEIYELIENIDAIDFINAINKYEKGSFSNISVNINNKSIDGTHGLQLYFNKGKWEVKDFAEKKRFGNRLFLINHVLRINEEKSNVKKKKKLIDYINFLRENFGIIFNKSLKSFYINGKVVYDYINENIDIDESLIIDIGKKYNIKKIDGKDKDKYINAIIYLYMLLEQFRQVEYMNYPHMFINYKKILNGLGLQETHENRAKLKFLLELGSKIEIHYNFINNNKKHIDIKKALYSTKISQKGIEYMPIIGNRNIEQNNAGNSLVLLNEKVFSTKGFYNKGNFKLMIYILYGVKKFSSIKVSLNQIINLIGVEGATYNDEKYMYKKINSLLKILLKYKMIAYYKRNKTTYTIGKKPFNKKV